MVVAFAARAGAAIIGTMSSFLSPVKAWSVRLIASQRIAAHIKKVEPQYRTNSCALATVQCISSREFRRVSVTRRRSMMTQPITVESADTTAFAPLGFFTVDSEGCTVRYGIEQTTYRVSASNGQYNAMYSLLLACWVERARVSLRYRLRRAIPNTSESQPREIVAVTALPAGSAG